MKQNAKVTNVVEWVTEFIHEYKIEGEDLIQELYLFALEVPEDLREQHLIHEMLVKKTISLLNIKKTREKYELPAGMSRNVMFSHIIDTRICAIPLEDDTGDLVELLRTKGGLVIIQ